MSYTLWVVFAPAFNSAFFTWFKSEFSPLQSVAAYFSPLAQLPPASLGEQVSSCLFQGPQNISDCSGTVQNHKQGWCSGQEDLQQTCLRQLRGLSLGQWGLFMQVTQRNVRVLSGVHICNGLLHSTQGITSSSTSQLLIMPVPISGPYDITSAYTSQVSIPIWTAPEPPMTSQASLQDSSCSLPITG